MSPESDRCEITGGQNRVERWRDVSVGVAPGKLHELYGSSSNPISEISPKRGSYSLKKNFPERSHMIEAGGNAIWGLTS